MAPIRVLSLCSGIGGLELGIGRAIDSRVVGYCERDSYAASVLLARQESGELCPAPIWCGNLEDLPTDEIERPDLICAGFPCQPFSTASRGRKVARDLWPEVEHRIWAARPAFVFIENVQRQPVEQACEDLEKLGYTAARDRFCASEVVCPSPRVRWFALAHLNGKSELRRAINEQMAGVSTAPDVGGWEEDPGRFLGMADGDAESRVDRLRCLGNAVVPAQAELAFRVLWNRIYGGTDE